MSSLLKKSLHKQKGKKRWYLQNNNQSVVLLTPLKLQQKTQQIHMYLPLESALFFLRTQNASWVFCLQSQLERQHLEDEVCRLEKEVTSLEEAKRDLDSRQVASDQTLQSHNAVIADLRLQLDSINMEKVGSGVCTIWTLESGNPVLPLWLMDCALKWLPLNLDGRQVSEYNSVSVRDGEFVQIDGVQQIDAGMLLC